MAKGFTKSENPDILVNIFTKARRKVDIYNNSLSGNIPSLIGLTSLTQFWCDQNSLTGSLPTLPISIVNVKFNNNSLRSLL